MVSPVRHSIAGLLDWKLWKQDTLDDLETPSWHSVVIKPAIRRLRWIVNYSSGTTCLISVVGDIKSGVRLAGRMRIVVLSFEDMPPNRVRQNNCMAPRM
jgi:hypothetical protein